MFLFIIVTRYERETDAINRSLPVHHVIKSRVDGRPFGCDDAVVDGVTVGAVGHDHVVTEDAFFDCTEALNGLLGFDVVMVGFELHADCA